jgi:LysE type translocator
MIRSDHDLMSLFEHDLFGKSVSTFPDHAVEMSAANFSLFLLAAVVIAAIPGPGIFYVAARTVLGGRRAGIASTFGTALGGLVHVIAGGIGVSAIILASAQLFTVLKLAGALYLAALFRAAGEGQGSALNTSSEFAGRKSPSPQPSPRKRGAREKSAGPRQASSASPHGPTTAGDRAEFSAPRAAPRGCSQRLQSR